jgi:hypothetical protein
MSRVSADEALRVLAKWSQARTPIQLAMSRSVRQHSDGPAVIDQVLPHSRKALLTLQDENGEDVSVTVSLEGAEWEYTDLHDAPDLPDKGAAVLPDLADRRRRHLLVATFPNGNRYAFEEQTPDDS